MHAWINGRLLRRTFNAVLNMAVDIHQVNHIVNSCHSNPLLCGYLFMMAIFMGQTPLESGHLDNLTSYPGPIGGYWLQ
jgi:hypothetical protein